MITLPKTLPVISPVDREILRLVAATYLNDATSFESILDQCQWIGRRAVKIRLVKLVDRGLLSHDFVSGNQPTDHSYGYFDLTDLGAAIMCPDKLLQLNADSDELPQIQALIDMAKGGV